MVLGGNIKTINPFLKWAGGKRWLVSRNLITFPAEYNRYIEPFLGSGAVFFAMQPHTAILSDSNENLIETYQAIKDDWKSVWILLKKHHRLHCNKYYYSMRESQPRTIHGKAALFIYLNRTCWNGLYRVNLSGKFNVPIGTKEKVILNTYDFESISNILKNTELLRHDFEEVINKAIKGDLVFIDPPYTVKHNNNNFIKYNENLFSWNDQIRLRDSLLLAKQRGAYVFSTNAYHDSVKNLYKENFNLLTVRRNSVIAAKSRYRQKCSELIIKSWE